MSDRLPEPLALDLQSTLAERASAAPRVGGALARADAGPLLRASSSGAASNTLAELQDWLVHAICDTSEHDSAGIVARGPRLSGRECVAIYRHGYLARLSECLRDDYACLAASVGDDHFDSLCRQYISQHPSSLPSLNKFGRFMPEVCAASSVLEHAAFCTDLARLEWALVEVTHAAAAPALDLQALQAIAPGAWSTARLFTHQALRLLRFAYPVNTHYQAYRHDAVLRPVPAPSPSATVVYRRELALWRMDLTPAMTAVLGALLEGSTIGEALLQMQLPELDAQTRAEAERSVMHWFQAWMSAGFFTQIETA